ncbi:MAG: IniB N-terminal domain-containing protein [Pseudonocardia sp.]|nr:IniB N-terminal domain-containing protein [Pseudonocardia sp.]
MVAFSDIIDFLLRLLSDEKARTDFEKDPQASLGKAGLEGVSAQDVRDARLHLADSGAVHATGDGGRSASHHHDPVREIGHTTTHYAATESHQPVSHGDTFFTIDDRDTLFFQSISDNDITVTDDHSVNTVVAIQDNDVNVSDNDTTINADGSFNSDNDVVAIQDNDVNGGDSPIDVDVTGGVTPGSAPAAPAPAIDPADDLAAVSGPAEADEEPVAEAPADEPAGDPVDDPADDLADDPVDDADADALPV